MELFNKIIAQYSSFRTNLKNYIKGPQNLNPSKDSFLIEEKLIKEIFKNNSSN